ncbi:MAG: hypothetical protein K1X89_17885 [Myxococcaceae bacterium]|nr:hypothetical protein [Myxococcaceae bacterium]
MRSFLVAAALVATCSSRKVTLRVSDGRALTLPEASDVLALYAGHRGGLPDHVPSTLQDAERAVAQSDLGAYPASLELAAKEGGLQGTALQARVHLGWGEDLLLARDVLARCVPALRQDQQRLTGLESVRPLTAEERQRLEDVDRELLAVAGVTDALTKVGESHLAQAVALQCEGTDPRVAAGLARLRGDWTAHDAAMAALDSGSPDATWERARAALARRGDLPEAKALLQTLAPGSPRAGAALVALEAPGPSAVAALEALAAQSPGHPLERWLHAVVVTAATAGQR